MKKLLRNLSVLCFVLAAFLTTGCYEDEMPFLEVDHEVVLVGPQTDKGTVVVTSNVQWTATSEVEWITIDNGFGNHKGTFEFFVAANTTPNERSGKIILESNDKLIKKTILVRQQSEGTLLTLATDHVAFTKYAGDYLMSIACNGEWKVASSADWCKVDPASGEGNGAFKITVEENNTGADRVAIISVLTEADGKSEVHQIEVTQSASNAALVVSPESKTLTAGAGEFELDVITVGTWEASCDSDWLTLSETEGNGDAHLTVSATANDTGKERIAVITFATGAENENRVIRQIVVRQAAVDFYLEVPVTDYPLSLEEQTIEIPYVLEGSNVTVTASSSSKWMTVQSVADGIATVKVEENGTAIAREGVISFITHGQAGDPIIRQVRVAQAPTINLLDVLADEYAVEWVGETFRIPIYSNTPVSVRSSEPWCVATAEGNEIVVAVAENTTAAPRVAVVTVTTDSETGEILSRTTIVRQAAAYSELVVSPAEKNLYSTAQSFVASIVTNNSWTASSDSDWLTIDKAEGTGDYMLTVNVAKNETGQVRVAVITVQTGIENSQRESATITVTQRPEQFYFEVPVRSYLVGKNEALIDVPYVTSGNEESVTASASVSWLRVQEPADGIVKVFVEENKTAEVRTGVVTITCTPVFGDPVAIPVTFTQAPTINILDVFVDEILASAKGDEFALPYYANTPVSVSSSETWCHAEVTVDEDSYSAECCSYSDPQKIIKIEVDPNRTGEARVAYVTISTVSESGEKLTHVITINQPALYAALSVNPKEVVLPAHNAEFNLTINTTGTWMATTSCTWLQTETDDEGLVAGFGDKVINWTAGVNDTGAARTAEIIVATGGENNAREEQVVKVTQLHRDTYINIPIEAYALTKAEQELIVYYFAAGDFKDMAVNCSEDWITYTGGDPWTLEFDIAENTTAEPRTATVTVTIDQVVGEPLTDTFTVTQAPTINILDVFVDTYEASPWGETIVFPLYGNTEIGYSVSSMLSGWCNILYGTPNQDVDPQELVVEVKKNESAEARVAYITLTTVTEKGEKLTHIITVHQNPLNAMLTVSPEVVYMPAHDAEFYMTIVTTGTWALDMDADTWCMPYSYDDWEGEGDASINFVLEDNFTGADRETTIIVWTGTENENRVEKYVKVIQLARDTYLEIPQESFFVAKEGFSGLDGQYFEVACIIAGDVKDVVVDCSESWIKFVDGEPNYLDFIVMPNETGAPRTATVTVTIDKVQGEPVTDTFTVTQAGTYNVLELLADYITVSPAGETVTLPALTNIDVLDVLISEPWLSASTVVDSESDNPNNKMAAVGIKAEANTTGRDRLASVTVSTVTDKGETIAKMIKVFQAAEETHFAILSGEQMFIPKTMADGKTADIVAFASVNPDQVTMMSDSDWLTLDGDLAVDGNIVTGSFKATINTTGEVRKAVVTVSFFDYNGAVTQKTVTIFQAAVDGSELEALIDYVVVPAEGTSDDNTVQLFFETEDPLTVSTTVPWLAGSDFVDPATDPQVLNIVAAENTTGKDRTGILVVSNGSKSVTITVFQPAKDSHFAVLSPDVVYVSNAGLESYQIEGYATENIIKSLNFYSDSEWLVKGEATLGNDWFKTLWNCKFAIGENTTNETRTATVKITYVEENGEVKEAYVTFIQSATQSVFDIPVNYVVLPAAGDFKDIAYISSEDVTVTSSSEWISHEEFDDPTTYIRITAAPNTTGLDRQGFVQATNGKEVATITVFQPAANTDFALLSADVMYISNAQTEVTFATYASVVADQVTALPDAEWLTWDGADGMFGDFIKIHHFTAAINDGEPRSTVVKFTYVDEKGSTQQAELTLVQAGADVVESVFNIPVNYLEMAAAGEFKDVAYISTDPVTVTSSSEWISHEENSDPTTYIRITAAPNTTGLDREGFVQVSNGKEMMTIVVFQPAANTVFAVLSPDVIHIDAAETSVNIIAYGSTVEKKADIAFQSDASWLAGGEKTLNGHKVSREFTAAPNAAEEAREASVLITYTDAAGNIHTGTVLVIQAGTKDDSVLEALIDFVSLDPAGEVFKLGFIANGALESATSSSSWLTAKVNADKSILRLEAGANTTGKARTAYVTVRNDKKTVLVTVFQASGEAEFTILDPNKAISGTGSTFNLRAYSSEEIEDLANVKVSSSADWLTKGTKDYGSNQHIVKVPFTATDNTTGAVREAVVTFTWIDGNGKTHQAEATVTQSPTENILDVYVDTFVIPYLETKDRLPVYSNATTVVPRSSNTSWLKVSLVTNTETQTRDINVVISKNETGETRTGYITITAKFADGTTEEKVITVIQLPDEAGLEDMYYLYFSVSDVTLPMEGGEKTVEVFTTATDYTLVSSEPWLTATKGSVKLNAEPNDTEADRDATVTVTATFKNGETKQYELTVTQLGTTTHYLNAPKTVIVDNEHIGGMRVSLNTDAVQSELSVDVPAEADWLTVAPYADAEILVTPTENTTGEQRNAFVTVTATYADGYTTSVEIEVIQLPDPEDVPFLYVQQEIFVKQNGYLPNNEWVVIPVYTNQTVAADLQDDGSGIDWLSFNTIADDKIILDVAENTTGGQRRASVVITAGELTATVYVKQSYGTEDPNYLVSWSEYHISKGDATKCPIHTNATNLRLTVPSDCDWLDAIITQSDEGIWAIDLQAKEDTYFTEEQLVDLEITATFGNGETLTDGLRVIRIADPEHYLSVPRTLVIDDSHIGGLLVPVRTDAEDSNMTVDTDASWLTITPAYYEGQILIEAELNPLSTDRSTFVTVQVTYPDGTVLTDDFEVVEKPKPEIAMHSVAFDPAVIDAPYWNPEDFSDPMEFPVNIITEGEVQSVALAEIGPSNNNIFLDNWVELDEIDLTNKSFKVIVDGTESMERKGTYAIVTVKFPDGKIVEANLPITQQEYVSMLDILPHYGDFDSHRLEVPGNQTTLYLAYETAVPWTETTDLTVQIPEAYQSWIHYDGPVGGTLRPFGTLKFTLSEYTGSSYRDGGIIFVLKRGADDPIQSISYSLRQMKAE